jgi:cellulose synthase/poly-beta-1,6-N-acetylglucosamine synthase-like glycosyltransferase
MLLVAGIFCLSLFILFYIYVGYPFLVLIISMIRSKPVDKDRFLPHVTILIAAYNEADVIEATVRNKLKLNYAADKLEIIVISDGSEDRTDQIVQALIPSLQITETDRETPAEGRQTTMPVPSVKLLRQEPRTGKTSALNMAVPHANGDIIVFSDANSIYDPDALMNLVQNFHDPAVGYVTGKMIYTNPQGSIIGDGCSTYMKYENALRTLESGIGSIVGVDGGIDAMRKALYKPMNSDQLPDFVQPLKVVEQGYRVVYEPAALLKEPALASMTDEYRMRVRVSLRAVWALHDMKHLFNPRKFGLFSWELLSHKWLRYTAFVYLLTAFVSNLLLLNGHPFFRVLMILQVLFYLAALLSFFLEKRGLRMKVFYIPYYFTLINLASAQAFLKFMMGEKQVIWTPRKG